MALWIAGLLTLIIADAVQYQRRRPTRDDVAHVSRFVTSRLAYREQVNICISILFVLASHS